MESTPKSRGKERTQKQNSKYPPKKDLPTNDSALGDDAPTTSGKDQGGHKEGLTGTEILTPLTHLPKAREITRQMEGSPQGGNRQSRKPNSEGKPETIRANH